MKKIIASPHAPKAVGPYSQAVEANGTLYISGQLPIDASTGKMPDTIEEQTRQALTNLAHIAAEAGYTLDDAVKATVLLDDMGDFGAMNGVYAQFFPQQMPARVCSSSPSRCPHAYATRWPSCQWAQRSRSTLRWRTDAEQTLPDMTERFDFRQPLRYCFPRLGTVLALNTPKTECHETYPSPYGRRARLRRDIILDGGCGRE